MAQQMTIDSEAVLAAVNQISLCTADIDTRIKKFVNLLEEKNAQTSGKFTLFKTLQTRIEEESKNIDSAIAAIEEIKEALRRYEDLAAQADDDAGLR